MLHATLARTRSSAVTEVPRDAFVSLNISLSHSNDTFEYLVYV